MNRTIRVTFGLALAAALAVAAPGTASANVASTSQCSSSYFCVWSGANYSGDVAITSGTGATATGMATTRSVWNRSTHAARVYSGSGGTGTSTCYAPGAMIAATVVASVSFRVLSTSTC